jgi:hypothetical protein
VAGFVDDRANGFGGLAHHVGQQDPVELQLDHALVVVDW